MRNTRRKKNEQLGKKCRERRKNYRQKEWEDLLALERPKSGGQTFYDVGSRVGLYNPSTPPISPIQVCSAIVGIALINSPFIKKKQEQLKRIALLNMGTHVALRLVMV